MNMLGSYIKMKRLDKGLSLRKFAELCGMSHSYLDNLEKGVDHRTGEDIRPTADILKKIADGLDIDATILFNLSIGEEPYTKEVEELSEDDIIILASKKLGYGDQLTEFEMEKVKLAIQIALTNNREKETVGDEK